LPEQKVSRQKCRDTDIFLISSVGRATVTDTTGNKKYDPD